MDVRPRSARPAGLRADIIWRMRTRSLAVLALVAPTLWASACEQVVDRDAPKPPDPTTDPDPEDPDDPPVVVGPIDPGGPVDQGPCAEHATKLAAIVDRLEADRVSLQIPGLSFGIVVGDCLFARGLGTVEAGGAAVDANTRFQIASMTKTLTAMTALSLEEDGIIDRQDPISQHVATTSSATLEQLLAHRAGYPIDLPDMSSYDLETLFNANTNAPMWATPDELFQYSNTGFALAGLVLQNATGTDYAELVRERVFIPAQMEDAAMAVELANTANPNANVAKGHSGDAANPVVIGATDEYIASTFYGPMGGAFVSASDMARLMYALMHENVLSSATIDDMTTSRGQAYGSASGYGQGIFTYYDNTIYHGGSVAGWLSEMDLDRERQVGIAVLTSSDWALPYDTMYAAYYDFLPIPPAMPASNAPSEQQMLGTYHDDIVLDDVIVANGANGMTITVFGDEQPLELYSPGVYTFMYTPWGMPIEALFQRGESGALYVTTTAGIARKQ